MPRVFLCHSTSDKPFVRRLERELKSAGIDVWVDHEDIVPGDSIRGRIDEAFAQVDFVVVVVGRQALARPFVRRELSAAIDLEDERGGRVVVPVLLERVKLPWFLRDKLYADFTNGFAPGMRRLLTALDPGLLDSRQVATVEGDVAVRIARLDGSVAYYEKRIIQKALSQHVVSSVEAVFTRGSAVDFRVQPGRVVRSWVESGGVFSEVEYPRPLRKGERARRTVSCRFLNGYPDRDGYWQVDQHFPGERFGVRISFPKGRAPTEWSAHIRRGAKVDERSDLVRKWRSKGHVVLKMEVKKPVPLSSYVLKWIW